MMYKFRVYRKKQFKVLLKGVLHPLLKISIGPMFCVLSQNYQHFFEKLYIWKEII